ncbi:MAG: sulfite oxidase [Nocardioidaceae bacterium]|nr:sulfite oxidase [Nocardioidaceae bacterium]NUS53141.1 sulfite oxidase [Nocardioidaceae bacterium]
MTTTRTWQDRAAPRVAEAGEGISYDELALAARNHAMPAEALQWDVTPVGLHYVLVHYDIPALDPDGWRLRVDGGTGSSVELTLDDLAAMPQTTTRVTLECAGNGRALLEPRPVSQPWLTGAVGTADWTGVPLTDLLDRVRLRDDAVDVVFTGADHGTERGVEQDYQRALPVDEALRGDTLVALTMNGAPLPVQHGFPARLVVPGWYGMAHVKWLTGIEVVDRTFDGFQHRAYRLRQHPDDEGVPVTRIAPRALIRPPGFPDFMTRERVLRPGPVRLEGRAWSGGGEVVRVEVSTDGSTWYDAGLGPSAGPHAWRPFTADWHAEVGDHVLRARATDASGQVQPDGPAWTRGGFANNGGDAVPVHVVAEDA